MLPGVAPPGRGAPGRGPPAPGPGRGPCGRGIGRSTGCALENGLLPTRGGRGRPGLGATGDRTRSPGGRCTGRGAAGAAGAVAAGAAGAGAAGGGCRRSGGGCGCGCRRLGCGRRGGAAATEPASTGALAGAPLPAALAGAGFSAAGALPPPNDSRSRRATGASTVDDADLTNSPCSLRRARTSLLVTPSSLANSCTRALPATTSPTQEATAVVGRASGLATTHGHRRNFTVCSCSSLPVLLRPGADERYSTTADVSGEPVMRNARAKARRRIAACRHRSSGCNQAPRPGRLPACVNGHGPLTVPVRHSHHSEQIDGQLSLPAPDACPHRSFGAAMPVIGAGVSRWITAQSTVTAACSEPLLGDLPPC